MRKEKSTKHALGRIRAQMRRLFRSGALSQKEVILFGCTMWTGVLMECLESCHLKAGAMIDNNQTVNVRGYLYICRRLI